MAYVLGFFAADGYMTINRRGAYFWNIQITDGQLLRQIKKLIQAEHKISIKRSKKKNKKMYRLQIGSKEMYNDLYNLGMRQNKTRSMVLPKIPDNYFSHFVRGYFDGDGNVWLGLVHKERKNKTLVIRTVFTSCSKNFLQMLKKRLEHYAIYKGVFSKGKGNYYRLTYSIHNSLKLSYFMYNMRANDIFLKRKKRIFDSYIRMRL